MQKRGFIGFLVVLVLAATYLSLKLWLFPANQEPRGGIEVNVKDFGAKGDQFSNDTSAIQTAIDFVYPQGGGTVYLPAGTYMVNPDQSIRLRSNIKLKLDGKAVLKARPSIEEYYNIILILNADNVEITGGKIVGERYRHVGTTGEWGSGIGILGSSNVHINDLAITDCWGDGIFIGPSWPNTLDYKEYCSQVTIERFNLYNNRRQGISVISAKNLVIRDGEASYQNGTRPESGIDLEPDRPSQFLENVLIENVTTKHNQIGILVALTTWNGSSSRLSINIKNVTDVGSPFPISYYRYYESDDCKITVLGRHGQISSYY